MRTRAQYLQAQKKKVEDKEEKPDEPEMKLPMNVIQYIEKVSPERIVQLTINYMDDRQVSIHPAKRHGELSDSDSEYQE